MLENKEIKDSTVTIRISEELKKKAELMAKKESRSLSNYIVYLLEKTLNKK